MHQTIFQHSIDVSHDSFWTDRNLGPGNCQLLKVTQPNVRARQDMDGLALWFCVFPLFCIPTPFPGPLSNQNLSPLLSMKQEKSHTLSRHWSVWRSWVSLGFSHEDTLGLTSLCLSFSVLLFLSHHTSGLRHGDITGGVW